MYSAISYSKCQTTLCFFVIPSRAEELFSFLPEMANASHSLISGLSLRETSKTQELRRMLLFRTPSVLCHVLLYLQREQCQIVYTIPGTVEQLRPLLWHRETNHPMVWQRWTITNSDRRAMRGGWGMKKTKAGIGSFQREAAGQYTSLITWSPPDGSVSFSGTLTAQAVTNKGNCTSQNFLMCQGFKTHYNSSRFPSILTAESWTHKGGDSSPWHRMQRPHDSKAYRDSSLCKI